VLAKLEAIRSRLITRPAMLVNVTVDDASWKAFKPLLADFLAKLPDTPFEAQAWPSGLPAISEGLALPSQVNFVSKGGNIFEHGYALHGSMMVASKYLGSTHLWNKIRVQGGAYGAFGSLDQRSGVWAFGSYRDPNLLGTLEAFDSAGEYLRDLAGGELTEEELTRAIIGTIGDWDDYLLPDAKGYTSMVYWLTGETEELRQRLRDEILRSSAADFGTLADALDTVRQEGRVVVIGSQPALEAANQEKGGFLKIEKVL
jgi:Zn-dependent M16 (insulinase) family peptidase